jgi:hypothetical protein
MVTARTFLSAALFTALRPKAKPWPYASGAASAVILGVLGAWLWVLNEEARLARTVAKTERQIAEGNLLDLRGRGEVVRARVAAIEEALTMPDDGETFSCFQRRAPRSRAASAAWWKEPVPAAAVWTAETGRWVLAGEVHGFQQEPASEAPTPDPYGIGVALARVRSKLAEGDRTIQADTFGRTAAHQDESEIQPAIVKILQGEGWSTKAVSGGTLFSRTYGAADEAAALAYSPTPEPAPPPGWGIRPRDTQRGTVEG